MKGHLLIGIIAVLMYVGGIGTSIYFLAQRLLDNVPHSAGYILTPALIGIVGGICLQGLNMYVLVKRVR